MTTQHTQHPTSAMAVANWFLEKSWQEKDVPQCDQMKLYKLVFYAHAWYLGNCGTELFSEDVEAWPHGPVVRDLYGQFKSFGRGPIMSLGHRLEVGSDGTATFVVPKHDGGLSEYLNNVWNSYKDQTGIQLSNGTHLPGEPWTIVAENYNYDLSSKPTIPSEIIENVFKQKVANAAAH